MKYVRLKKNSDFQKLLKKGTRSFSRKLALCYLPSDKTRMGICVGKKHGKAHTRNRVKRLLREAFRAESPALNGTYSFLLLPKAEEEYSYRELRQCLHTIFKREDLLT